MSDVQPPPHPSLTPPPAAKPPSFPTSSLTTDLGRECVFVCVTVCTGTLALYGYFGAVWRVDPAHPDLHCQGVRRFVFARSHDLQSYPGCCGRKKGLPNKVRQAASCAAQIPFDTIFLKMDQRKDFEVSDLVPRLGPCLVIAAHVVRWEKC